jgi:capsular exopolysaccharide synthesis family protein
MVQHNAAVPNPASVPFPGQPEQVAGRIEPALPPTFEAQLPPGLSASPSMGALLQALRRRWVAAVCLGGTLAGLAALAVWFLMAPKHTAFARIRVAYEQPSVVGRGPNAVRGDFKTYLRTQAQQLYNRNVILAALASDEVRRLNLESLGTDPADYLEAEGLKTELHDDSEIVTPTLMCSDPVVATAVLKAILAAYKEQVIYAEERNRSVRLNQLEKSFTDAVNTLKSKKDNLRETEKRLKSAAPGALPPHVAEMLKTADTVAIAQHVAEVQATIRDLQHQRDQIDSQGFQIEADLQTVETRLRSLKEPESGPAPNVKLAMNADTDIKEYQKRIRNMEEFLDKYRARGTWGPSASLVQGKIATLEAQIERRQKEIEEELKSRPGPTSDNGRDGLQLTRTRMINQLAAMKKRRDALEQELRSLQDEKAALGRTNSEYETSLDQVRNAQQLANDLERALELERVEQAAAPRTTILQDAELQRRDIKKQVLFTIAAPLAVLFGICMALAWAEFRQRRIRRASEVAAGLGIRVVGAVPDMPHLEKHLVTADGAVELEGHPVLESIDALRTLLLHGGGLQTVLVTSATSGEGKTTLAAHLAGSLARAGRKTLLVDGDLRNPTAHQLFELAAYPGLSEALLEEVDLAAAIRPTPLEGLSLLAAGQWDREVMQALARNGLQGLIDRLRQEYEFVIIDSHPVLAATDSLLLGRHADGVLLSVLREVSQMPRVYAAAQRLTSLGIRVLGAVVNAADPDEALPAPPVMSAA